MFFFGFLIFFNSFFRKFFGVFMFLGCFMGGGLLENNENSVVLCGFGNRVGLGGWR